VWFLLAHVLYKIYELTGKTTISVEELERLLLYELWGKYRVAIYENSRQIERDLKILQLFGYIKLQEKNVELNLEELKAFEEDEIQGDPMMQNSRVYWTALLREALDHSLKEYYNSQRASAMVKQR
jgi:hypothetical protein